MKRQSEPYYFWKVIYDPECVYLGPFREIDLRLTAEVGYWPEGIVFEHKLTGERKIFKDGQLISLPPSISQESLR